MNRIFKSAIFYLVLVIAVIWVFNFYRNAAEGPVELTSVNEFVERVEAQEIASAQFLTRDEKVVGELTSPAGKTYELFLPHGTIDNFAALARENEVEVTANPQQGSVLVSFLFQFLPIVIIVGSSSSSCSRCREAATG